MNREPRRDEVSGQRLGTEGGPATSNAIDVPSLALPTGGGAIKGIDEKFAVNAANGTATLSIALPFSPAREAGPAPRLTYDSGAGNGVFGLGWTLSVPSIKRRTDGALPHYRDSDTFTLSNRDDLVPELHPGPRTARPPAGGDLVVREHDSSCGSFTVTNYRLRIEGLFSRIERWTHKTTGEIKWRVISKENQTTLFGWTAASRISDPADERRVVTWLPELVLDDKGNCAHYVYGNDTDACVDTTSLHNRNRLLDGGRVTFANRYLERVLYGNRTPCRSSQDVWPQEADYAFQTVFDYGEYDALAPFAKRWFPNVRGDPFSEYRAGFEVRTTRLCERVLLFHHFADLPGGSALVKSLDLSYGDPGATDLAFLRSITEHGYIKKSDGTYSVQHLPPVEFEYRRAEWNTEIRSISQADLAQGPSGPDGPRYQFIDLYNEGLPGMLTELGEAWYYQRNLGQGRFTTPAPVARKPSFVGVGSHLQVMDLNGDGGKQLVSLRQEPRGYFELNVDEQQQAFRSFETLPNVDFGTSTVRLMDLNGDGRFEVLVSEDNVFTWYESVGRKGFAQASTAPKSFDEEQDPQLVFSDATQTIFVADMAGDGLADIVRIRNGHVCYWPNLGHGRFGAKVTMDDAPVFDHPDAFDPDRLRLADIDGSGPTDLIYIGTRSITFWKNLSGNRFSTAVFEIEKPPEVHSQSDVSVVDLLGDGVACIVWSSSLVKDAGAPLKYVDVMGGRKPHLLVGYRNNLGKEVSLEYKSSTQYYLDDRLAGRSWVTELHFPVHCVSRTEIRDRPSGHRYASSYAYHHGYFDRAEREFRGFGMVEQADSEDFDHVVKGDAARNILDHTLHQPPVVTRQWFHTGAWMGTGKTLDQFAHEYWPEAMARQGFPVVVTEAPLGDVRVTAAPGLDPVHVERMSGGDWREALRACKGVSLRTEVFAHDAPAEAATPEQRCRQLTPYSVEARRYVVELLQPSGANQHAVFVVRECDTIVYDYDRDLGDPRTSHRMNIEFDEYGNVLESAAISYPRQRADASLPAETQHAQGRTVVLYTRNRYTNDATGEHSNRLRVLAEATTFELTAVARSGPYFEADDLRGVLTDPRTTFVEHPGHGARPKDGTAHARLLDAVRHTFYDDGLTGALPLHGLNSLALPYQSYRLAYTPSLLADIFGTRVDDAVMLEGGFTHSDGDDAWWVPSGSKQFLGEDEGAVEARERFYAPVSYMDPHGARTKVRHDRDHFFITQVEDAAGNRTTVDRFDFRTLSAARLTDANANLSEVLVDELGRVKALAVYGKGDEADDLVGLADFTDVSEAQRVTDLFAAADSVRLTVLGEELLQHATARFVYDFDAYSRAGQPAAVATIVREEHHRRSDRSPVRMSFEYSNGLGQVVMEKAQAAPGRAKRVVVSPDDTYQIAEVDTAALEPRQLRWIGSGRKVRNNKGKTVKQYEPYFSVSHGHEDLKELVETGVTPLMYHDPLGRLVTTVMPDGTFSLTEFGGWRQIDSDANDNVMASTWYDERIQGTLDAESVAHGNDPVRERTAAEQAARHADTPSVRYFDGMGRTILSVEHNRDIDSGEDEFHLTMHEVDVCGHLRTVTDATGNVAARYGYDLLGNRIYQDSPDSGRRWLLANVLGSPLRAWDERDHEIRYHYEDPLHRPTHSRVLGGDGPVPLDHVFDRRFYGESEAEAQRRNVRGRVTRHFDTAGLLEIAAYDIGGRPTSTTRRFSKDYTHVVNWIDGSVVGGLEDRGFTTAIETNARGETTRHTAPDGSVVIRSFDEGGLLYGEAVVHSGSEATAVYVAEIGYNERGQRERVVYGNGVVTTFGFDRKTFRIRRMETRRRNGELLQDWRYTYDPVGNITCIEDRVAPVVFFKNQKVASVATYAYDPLYRLIEATGRENDADLEFGNRDAPGDSAHLQALTPGDPLAMRNYLQRYEYDAVGNIRRMRHRAARNNWTRQYTYGPATNRLIDTRVGANTYAYSHHPRHGFMTSLPHLASLGWNFREELTSCARQRRSDGGKPRTTYFQYDSDGRRIRKITERQAAAGDAATPRDERIYLDGYELYSKHAGTAAGLERVSLKLMDEGHRFVMVETRNTVDDGTERQLVRYQLPDHLGSASLELDGSNDASVVSYEEFHPYGTTAYQARNASIRSAAKRYRFTGMERDGESGFTYHGARYYAPWLGRWISCDPLLMEDGGARQRPKPDVDGEHAADTGRAHGRLDLADAPSPDVKSRPALCRERGPPAARENSSGRDAENPYAYVSQNPIVARDPTGEVGIIQAWYDGYSKASTAGKVGFGFLFLFAWLAHVVVNLAVLVFAVFLQNPLSFWDFTWGVLQSALGLVIGIVMILFGAQVAPRWGLGAKVELPAYMGSAGGMSLGPVVLATRGFSDYQHEFGHTWQSRLLGPFYLFVIGIPSLISAGSDPSAHRSFYTERWADAWAT